MQWYYAKDGQQVGPIEDTEFHDLVRSERIGPETPVWREGLEAWTPYGKISGRRATAAPRKKLTLARDADPAADDAGEETAPAFVTGGSGVAMWAETLYRAKGWIRLVGVMAMIGGILQCLTIIGAVIGWLPIWLGVTMLSVAKHIELAYASDDELAFGVALDKVRLYFTIIGVLTLLGIIFAIIGLAASILLPLMMASRF